MWEASAVFCAPSFFRMSRHPAGERAWPPRAYYGHIKDSAVEMPVELFTPRALAHTLTNKSLRMMTPLKLHGPKQSEQEHTKGGLLERTLPRQSWRRRGAQTT